MCKAACARSYSNQLLSPGNIPESDAVRVCSRTAPSIRQFRRCLRIDRFASAHEVRISSHEERGSQFCFCTGPADDQSTTARSKHYPGPGVPAPPTENCVHMCTEYMYSGGRLAPAPRPTPPCSTTAAVFSIVNASRRMLPNAHGAHQICLNLRAHPTTYYTWR